MFSSDFGVGSGDCGMKHDQSFDHGFSSGARWIFKPPTEKRILHAHEGTRCDSGVEPWVEHPLSL
jgi:hypothetical protein